MTKMPTKHQMTKSQIRSELTRARKALHAAANLLDSIGREAEAADLREEASQLVDKREAAASF